MRYGDGDPSGLVIGPVRELQRALMRERYDLPRWGDDGKLGDETWRAIVALGKDSGFVIADAATAKRLRLEVPLEILELLTERPVVTATAGCSGLICEPFASVKRYDLRSERVLSAPKISMVGGKARIRRPEDIDTFVIHQTDVEFGVSAQQIQRAGGDEELARAQRALGVACHVMAHRQGFFTAATPFLVHVNHGNGYNPRSLGGEVDGCFEGVEGDPKTIPSGRKVTQLTEALVEALRAMLWWTVEEAAREGIVLKYIRAHRQSSATRRRDPGSALWKAGVLDYAEPRLGLSTAPAEKIGDGRAIPREWDPNGVVGY